MGLQLSCCNKKYLRIGLSFAYFLDAGDSAKFPTDAKLLKDVVDKADRR